MHTDPLTSLGREHMPEHLAQLKALFFPLIRCCYQWCKFCHSCQASHQCLPAGAEQELLCRLHLPCYNAVIKEICPLET